MSNIYEHYLSTKETAQALKVSRRTLARYKSEGKIRPVVYKGKHLYDPKVIAHFSADSETQKDKIEKQTAYNSYRLAMLEIRINALEQMLNLRSHEKVLPSQVNVDKLRTAFENICYQAPKNWDIPTIENVLKDVSRFSDELISAIGKDLIRTTLELTQMHAQRIKHTKSNLMLGRCATLLKHVN